MRFAFACLLILAAGAASAQPPTAPRAHDYFPLYKGTKWTFKVGDNEVVVVAVGPDRVKDEDCVRVETRVGKDAITNEWYAVRPDGVHRVRVKDDALVPPVKVLPVAIKVGESWSVDTKFGAQSIKGKMTVKSDRERVTVPAGEFDAVLVEGVDLNIAGARTTVRIWFAKDRGIVKEEFVLLGGEKLTLELAKFEPGEAPPSPPPTAPPAVAWASPPPCPILVPQCCVFPVTTQESRGCCVRSGRLLARWRY